MKQRSLGDEDQLLEQFIIISKSKLSECEIGMPEKVCAIEFFSRPTLLQASVPRVLLQRTLSVEENPLEYWFDGARPDVAAQCAAEALREVRLLPFCYFL
jgi:hypothetical protein